MMGSMCIPHMIIFLMIIAMGSSPILSDKFPIGVCYGMQGNNLPSPADVVALYNQYGIGKIRLFDPNHSVLEALRGSSIEVTIGTLNEDIQTIASSQDAAHSWFASNIQPYINAVNIKFLLVGNEVIPGPFAANVATAIQNLQNVLAIQNLNGIRVSTAVNQQVLQNTYPPSASEFQPAALGPLVDILRVISGRGVGTPTLMINLYPYFAYAATPDLIRLDYAQFTATEAVFHDGNLAYFNLFDSMLDGVYWAMEKAGFPGIDVAVSESGWPSAGNGNFTTPQLALTYNKNLVHHILNNAGSPKRPDIHMEAFLFAMFNENLKPAGVEQNWGLFYPTKQPVYPIFSGN